MNNQPVTDMDVQSNIHEDESTIDSCEISIEHELMLKGAQTNIVSGTPKSLAPKPILLRLPCTSPSCNLGVELALSLPLIAYIHPTSPLLNVLHVGDVILELDGKRTTDLRFEQLNSWFSGRSSSSDCINDGSGESCREKCILFLPGRNSPFNPESSRYDPDGLKCHSLLVKLSDVEKSSNETGCGDELLYFRQETGATDEMTEKSESDVSEAVRECDASGIKGSLDATGTVPSPDCSEREDSVSSNLQEECDATSIKGCSVLSVDSKSTCTLYLDDTGTVAPSQDCSEREDSVSSNPSDFDQRSSIATPKIQSTLEKYMVESMDDGDKKEAPVSPSTTATTFSNSTPDGSSLEEASSSSDSSSVRSSYVQTIPNNFIAPDLNSPDESAGSINYPSSPLMVFEHPSPQSSVSLSEELNKFESMVPSLPFETESCHADEDKESVIAETVDESGSSSTTEHVESQQEFDTFCKSVLEKNGIADDAVESQENEETPSLDIEPIQCPNVDHLEESANEAAANDNLAPSTLQKQATSAPEEEEEEDWEKLQQKRRKRPAPAIETITVDLGCDEDISTIYGGKYNPDMYAARSRVEDNLIDFTENGKYDPNTMSQLIVHGLGSNARFQNESNQRKIELERQDHQMKEERLNLLKRRHCIIESMFAAFIFVAVIVLVGVLVVVLRG
jgi:hypothetical protein